MTDIDPNLIASGEELQARALIAAALIQRGAIDVSNIGVDFSQSWTEQKELMKLNGLLRRIFDAVQRKF